MGCINNLFKAIKFNFNYTIRESKIKYNKKYIYSQTFYFHFMRTDKLKVIYLQFKFRRPRQLLNNTIFDEN